MFVTLGSMSSLEEPGPGWNSADTGSVRTEALDVLSDALSWRLAGPRWAAIEQVLAAMDAALAAGDVAALATATADLELAGPCGSPRSGPIPSFRRRRRSGTGSTGWFTRSAVYKQLTSPIPASRNSPVDNGRALDSLSRTTPDKVERFLLRLPTRRDISYLIENLLNQRATPRTSPCAKDSGPVP